MKVVGITGGVGAGKSNVMSYLNNNTNCFTILADDLAKQLCNKGFECYRPLVELLGEDVLDDGGQIDRGKMAAAIFRDSSLRESVNAIIHPEVKKTILNGIDFLKKVNKYDYFFLEAALLIEDGYKEIVDEMWYIYASEDVRRKRLKESRAYSDEKIDNIFKSQLPDSEFRANCDFVIDNSGSLEYTVSQIKERING